MGDVDGKNPPSQGLVRSCGGTFSIDGLRASRKSLCKSVRHRGSVACTRPPTYSRSEKQHTREVRVRIGYLRSFCFAAPQRAQSADMTAQCVRASNSRDCRARGIRRLRSKFLQHSSVAVVFVRPDVSSAQRASVGSPTEAYKQSVRIVSGRTCSPHGSTPPSTLVVGYSTPCRLNTYNENTVPFVCLFVGDASLSAYFVTVQACVCTSCGDPLLCCGTRSTYVFRTKGTIDRPHCARAFAG